MVLCEGINEDYTALFKYPWYLIFCNCIKWLEHYYIKHTVNNFSVFLAGMIANLKAFQYNISGQAY